jgi:subtilase family serine protease
LSPQEIQTAYGINLIRFFGGQIVGNGARQTIAIITAYNDSNITADLATFDNQFGLTSPPSTFFNVWNLGATTTDAGWALETSLDVEWAHAIAPGANILLVEAPSASAFDLLTAVNEARSQPGVSVVSMSWGMPEFQGEQGLDPLFNTPVFHNGVTFVAASGDSGAWYGPMYPSVSPGVLAVGGTSLTLSPVGGYGSETGWSGSTGGFSGYDMNWSSYETKPAYQTAALQAAGLDYGVRTTPDVSFNADPNSGVSVYDSVPYNGQSGWFQVGGTSAAAPAWAGLIAIANQGLNLAGVRTLSGTQALWDLYALPSSFYHDITSGFNGYSATPGYDLVTGLGTPQAYLVVAGLLYVNGASGAYASPQPSVAATANTAGATTSSLDLTVSQTGGALSGRSSVTVGLPEAGPILTLASNVSGSSILTSGTSILVFTPQTPTTQTQTVVARATTVNLDQALPPSVAPGQSLIQQSDISSRDTEIGSPSEPNGPTDEVLAFPAPASLPVKDTAPAPLETPETPASEAPASKASAPETPATEAPAPTPEPEPAPHVNMLSVENFDLALAELNTGFEEEGPGSPPAPWPAVEQASDGSPSWKVPMLAGTAAIAAAGYRLVLGRSDRIRRRWTRTGLD